MLIQFQLHFFFFFYFIFYIIIFFYFLIIIDKYLKKCLSKIKRLSLASTPNYRRKYSKLVRKTLKAHKSILYSLFLMYSQMGDYDENSRTYRLWIPGGERRLSKNYYSEYILFAAQSLLSGVTLPRLEEYTAELQNRALDLFSCLSLLYKIIYHRIEFSLLPPYTDLAPYLCDFDKFWLLLEKRLYTCYHNIYHISKIKNSQIIIEFQVFLYYCNIIIIFFKKKKKIYIYIYIIFNYNLYLYIKCNNPFFFTLFSYYYYYCYK